MEEARFLNAKKRISKLTAINDEHLLPEEVGAADSSAAGELAEKARRNEISRCKKRTQNKKILAMASRVNLQEARVRICKGVAVSDLQPVFRQDEMRATMLSEAEIIVVKNVKTVGTSTNSLKSWHAALCGLRVCTPRFIQTRGKHGASIVYSRATACKRRIWLSKRFLRTHPDHAKLVIAAASGPQSKWTILACKRDYIHHVKNAVRQNRPNEVLALIAPRDRTTWPILRDLKGARLGKAFFRFVARLDSQASTSGMCGS